MKITKDEVKKIAELSRIKLNDEEAEKMSENFDDILKLLSQISEIELDSENIERNFDNLNTFREDEIKDNENQKLILEEMPETEKNYLKVKKILSN